MKTRSPLSARPLIALLVLTIVAYLPACWAGFIWDDPDYVVHNQTLRDMHGLWTMWTVPTSLPQWYPMVHSTFWLEWHAWGANPIGYHVDNVLLQAAGAILLWRVLRRLSVPGAWLAAAIFAVHPVHVESVAWISERKNTLSTLFYLLAALAWLRARGLPEKMLGRAAEQSVAGPPEHDSPQSTEQAAGASRRNIRIGWYIACLALFAAALFSKTVACTFPAAILLIVYWKTGRLRWRDVWPTLPLFAIGVSLGLVTAVLERTHVRAVGKPWDLSFAQRTIIAGRALWFYAAKLAVPCRLAFIYERWHVDAHVAWQYLFPLTAIGVILAMAMLARTIGRGPLVGVLFFAGTLFPALGFFNIFPMRYSFVADHFQHLASIGLTTLVAAAVARWRLRHRWPADIVAGGVVAACVALSFMQTSVYASAETLWRDAAAKSPNSWMVYVNLGKALTGEGRAEEAVRYYEQALRLAPELPETHHDLAEARIMQGRLDEAQSEFKQALAIDPNFAPSYLGLAKLEFFSRRRPDVAATYFRKCLSIDPTYGPANFGYGELLESKGDLAGACEHYRLAASETPDDFDAAYNLGTVLLRLDRPGEAIGPLENALRIEPNSAAARSNLMVALRRSGRGAEADEMDREAMREELGG